MAVAARVDPKDYLHRRGMGAAGRALVLEGLALVAHCWA